MGHKVKRGQQAQRGKKDHDGKIWINRYSRNSMPQAVEALGGRTHCNLSPKLISGASYLVTRVGDVTGVTPTAPRGRHFSVTMKQASLSSSIVY
jgi:hypothetical protein